MRLNSRRLRGSVAVADASGPSTGFATDLSELRFPFNKGAPNSESLRNLRLCIRPPDRGYYLVLILQSAPHFVSPPLETISIISVFAGLSRDMRELRRVVRSPLLFAPLVLARRNSARVYHGERTAGPRRSPCFRSACLPCPSRTIHDNIVQTTCLDVGVGGNFN